MGGTWRWWWQTLLKISLWPLLSSCDCQLSQIKWKFLWSFKVLTTEKVIVFPARLITFAGCLSRHVRGSHIFRKMCYSCIWVSQTFTQNAGSSFCFETSHSPQVFCSWTFVPFLLSLADASSSFGVEWVWGTWRWSCLLVFTLTCFGVDFSPGNCFSDYWLHFHALVPRNFPLYSMLTPKYCSPILQPKFQEMTRQ